VLRIFLSHLPACQRSPLGDLALERVRRSVTFLDNYADRYLPDHPWPHLEYFCGICVDRLGWTGFGWEHQRLAFLDDDYEDRLRQLEQIDTARRHGVELTAPGPTVTRSDTRLGEQP
jgi:hypothetical protein